MAEATKTIFRCSFCGKDKDQVQKLIAGLSGQLICDECVWLCMDILRDEGIKDNRPVLSPEQQEEETFKELQKFFGTPDRASTMRRMAAVARAAKGPIEVKK